jgi:hypothetical protein
VVFFDIRPKKYLEFNSFVYAAEISISVLFQQKCAEIELASDIYNYFKESTANNCSLRFQQELRILHKKSGENKSPLFLFKLKNKI